MRSGRHGTTQMRISAKTVDDVLHDALNNLMRSKKIVVARRGKFKERIGVHILLSNPLARLSRSDSKGTLISCFAEAVWYMAGSSELALIEHYIPNYRRFLDNKEAASTPGAYGPRLFSPSLYDCQVQRVIKQLKDRPTSRQAVIQFFSNSDLDNDDPPCTCTLQFFVRNRKLHLIAHMRSNDAFKGLPHDIFAFTWIQEMISRSLGLDLGNYQHMVGSLHLYEEDLEKAKKYLDEGWFETDPMIASMPKMPSGDPWSSINWLLGTEELLRKGIECKIDVAQVDGYWKDVARILSLKSLLSDSSVSARRTLVEVSKKMNSPIYAEFAGKKSRRVLVPSSQNLI
jgi:thymidylate synthase